MFSPLCFAHRFVRNTFLVVTDTGFRCDDFREHFLIRLTSFGVVKWSKCIIERHIENSTDILHKMLMHWCCARTAYGWTTLLRVFAKILGWKYKRKESTSLHIMLRDMKFHCESTIKANALECLHWIEWEIAFILMFVITSKNANEWNSYIIVWIVKSNI